MRDGRAKIHHGLFVTVLLPRLIRRVRIAIHNRFREGLIPPLTAELRQSGQAHFKPRSRQVTQPKAEELRMLEIAIVFELPKKRVDFEFP